MFDEAGPQRVEVTATVRRTRVVKPESGFRVVEVVLDDGQLDTWVGVMPALTNGHQARAVGTRETYRGETQLRVQYAVPVLPLTVEGIEEYLGSGVIPGVGPVLAKRLVGTFGTDTLTVIEQQPERIAAEVLGIGPKKGASIGEAWGQVRVVGTLIAWLQSHGASPALAARIFKRYGARAIEVVSVDPYRLALDVPGVGFLTADKIAVRLGVAHDSPSRLKAGALHCLEEARNNGHTYLDVDDLAGRARKLLDVGDDLVRPGLRELEAAGAVVREGTAVFLAQLHATELRVTARVTELLAALPAPVRGHVLPPAAVIARYEHDARISLAPEQREAVLAAFKHKVLVITGGPGTGKTTITKGVLALFESMSLRVRLASPTGRAAKRMAETTGREATTLHRLLEYSPDVRRFLRDLTNPLDAEAVIVDEASMVDVELADSLLAAVPNAARLIIVGDVDQLPSVGPGAVLRDLIDSGVVPTVRLARIFRQAEGSGIVDAAHQINAGNEPVGAPKGSRGDFFVVHRPSSEHAADLVVRLVTERIPLFGIAAKDVRVLSPMKKGAAGTIALNERLQAALNPTGPSVTRGTTVFRVGDIVLQTKNDGDLDVYNGEGGVILRVEPSATADGKHVVVVDVDGREVAFEETDLAHLQLGYASTVHKAQGGQFKAVVVVMLSSHYVMLSRNLLYTAVTRGEKLVTLITDPMAMRTSLAETRRHARSTALAPRLRAASAVLVRAAAAEDEHEHAHDDDYLGRHLIDDMEAQ